jgi:Mg-chelatase subunit ChlI
LIRHAFDPDLLPSTEIDTFYEYIRDLRGYTRTRLREAALEVKTEDMKQGPTGFPPGTADTGSKGRDYTNMMSGLSQPTQGTGKRKRFNEVEFMASTSTTTVDGVVTRRVVKRMRAEMVLDELTDPAESEEGTNSKSEPESGSGAESAEEETQPETNKSANQPTKRRRVAKLRSNMPDSSSSEDGTSEESSSSSSEDDSDEEDGDVDMEPNEDTSSSSSSSSSDDEDDDEDDSAEDEEGATAANAGVK